ncbi:alpha-amylase family glycosyl hydrolase [Cellvibrio japonicus]|uniref:Alpha amylase, putative, amy13F n=1 Tax=Cellvibrio japonicus (strain Ueda107) TaxID=498211 RepID=B3PI59_CELJU|nr:alpha-amylase family glycosyl hydrolase [Cellvibrio japonicus]ACE84068.1 alpha amylase, putative, amy13F [Cellvibrio japonicus Ueda107]QEI11107.1 alpha-amylase [Cellvibrio japonicus]QEI14681.1 alpha-amylase [Cellvibrio japonicus]QEI18261.1 alpha-amylase [Cellvibrio japonicus]
MKIMLSVLALLLVLTACGGGGGSSQPSHPSDSSTSASSLSSLPSSSSLPGSSSIAASPGSSPSSSSQSTSSAVSVSSAFSSSSAAPVVTVYYQRLDKTYSGWGLHLWGSAIPASTVTTWANARPFDGTEGDWAVARVPLSNGSVAFNFIVHKGDFKSPTADLGFVPATSGNQVWVIQDDNTLYFNQAEAELALANVGNASAALDLSPVEPVANNSGLPPDWHKRANFMQIFVRSYKDSDGDGVGDFQGLISKLDYLQALGITGIWLMPMTESSDNDHGYAVSDYRKVESDYGTADDFAQLLAEAHARGIGVIIDYVINHSSSANPLFIDAASAANNSKRDWYIFSNTNPGWTSWGGNPTWHSAPSGDYYYGVFTAGLPDFNLRNQQVVDYHRDNLRFWLNRGVDGIRFDATGVLFENGPGQWSEQPENHPLLAEIRSLIDDYGNRYAICESPDAPDEYVSEDSCGRVFAFGHQWTIRDSARNRSLHTGLVQQLNSAQRLHMPFILSNHDSFAGSRPATDLTLAEYRVASAIAILASDTPFTYYGEEIGMANGSQSGDPGLRTPMSWTANTSNAGFTTATPYRGLSTNVASRNVAAQEGVAGSLLEHYRSLYQLRNQYPVLAMGELQLQSNTGNSHVVFRRTLADGVAAILINLSNSAQVLTADIGQANLSLSQRLPDSSVTVMTDNAGNVSLSVPAQSVVVISN